MRRPFIYLAVSAACLLSTPSHAVNKCTGPDGKVAFQDAPCAGRGEVMDIKPASGSAQRVVGAAGAAPQTAKPATTTEGVFGESWQRRTFLENRGIPDTQAAINGEKQGCDRKLAELRSRQGSANNNLAGATYLQSLAAEMQATATVCDTRSRELNTQLDSMKKELRELQSK